MLIEVEISARDAEQFDLAASSIPVPTWAYLTSLEWIGARQNLTLIGPADTGKSHAPIALGHAAVEQGLRVQNCTATELVENLLPRPSRQQRRQAH